MNSFSASFNYVVNYFMPKNNYENEQLNNPTPEILPDTNSTIDVSNTNYLLPFDALNVSNNKIFNSFETIDSLMKQLEQT